MTTHQGIDFDIFGHFQNCLTLFSLRFRYNPKRTMFDRSSSRTSEHDDYETDRRQSSIRSSVVAKNIKTREDLIQLQTKHNGSEQRSVLAPISTFYALKLK